MSVKNAEQLINTILEGTVPEYHFFWNGPFSQWHVSPFHVGYEFVTAEHFMMVNKALVHGDEETALEIFKTLSPAKAKSLGREVRNYNEEVWDKVRYKVVVMGSYAKFTQNDDLKNFILNTGDKVLVEASPYDTIWGIGMDEYNTDAMNPQKWKGQNLLGFALMEVRDMVRNGEEMTPYVMKKMIP